MCGFAGVIAWDERYRVSRDTLAKMSAAIAHRGPDGEGMYFSPDAEITPDRPQVALAHRRLAIIDPDPRANQPFTDAQGRWLVFNGEIYNFRELRAELTSLKPDYEWRTDCDTEVLLIAYDAWGEKCVERFNGMFAFAIWDGVKRELFLARDRMGQKPLYYTNLPRSAGIAFASELQSLRELPWACTNLDQASLIEYLRWGYVPANLTAFRHIAKLEPGHVLSSDDPESQSYFDSNRPNLQQSNRTSVRTLVERAVSRQVVADVPLGCFLSGGLDSSVIALAMTKAAQPGQRVQTFSIGFDDPRYDETQYATAIAAHLGTAHRAFEVKPKAADDLPKLARVFGEPFADSSALPTQYLARETRGYVKVALSGDGGDELFGGYRRYRAMQLEGVIRRVPRSMRRAFRAIIPQTLLSRHPKSLGSLSGRLLQSIDLPTHDRYASYMRYYSDSDIIALLSLPAEQRLGDGPWIDSLRRVFSQRNRGPVECSLAFDRVTYLPDDLLTKVDRASMLHALEVRSPFMDHELVQFAAGLTTDQLLKGGPKRMLREAFANDLPAWVFKRKKMGFAVPIGEWFRDSLRPMLHDHLFASDSFAASHFNMNVVRRLVDEHHTARVDHSQRLYALLMLELWWKTQRG